MILTFSSTLIIHNYSIHNLILIMTQMGNGLALGGGLLGGLILGGRSGPKSKIPPILYYTVDKSCLQSSCFIYNEKHVHGKCMRTIIITSKKRKCSNIEIKYSFLI